MQSIRTQRFSTSLLMIVIFGSLALVGGLIPPRPPLQAAQVMPPRAGIVVRFGDGSIRTACVELDANGEASGEEVLRASGLALITEFTPSYGTLVCKIEQEGCPANDCLCQCKNLGQDCRYWSYYHLGVSGWEYSNLGASGRLVRDGMVEGWSWGPGGVGSGVEPPPITFGAICPLPATATPTPTPFPSPTLTPLPSATAMPSATMAAAPVAPAPIILPVASSTPSGMPSATAPRAAIATATESSSPTVALATATLAPTATLEPLPTLAPTATLEPLPTLAPTATLEFAPPSATALPISQAAGEPVATATAGPLWLPLVINAVPTLTPAPTATPELRVSPTISSVGSAPTVVPNNSMPGERAASPAGLGWFLALSGGLAVALVAARTRRGG